MLRFSLNKNSWQAAVKKALEVLGLGGIVAYPTESYYALGVKADNKSSVSKLFALKKRPLDKSMPVIVGSKYVLLTVVDHVPEEAEKLMKEFWPGALTIIFDARDGLPKILTGSANKVAVRIPGKSFALEMAKKAGFSITATSANNSGSPPSRTPEEVINYFGEKTDLIIDAGRSPGGKPSTIIDVTVSPPEVLRKGRIELKAE